MGIGDSASTPDAGARFRGYIDEKFSRIVADVRSGSSSGDGSSSSADLAALELRLSQLED